MTGNTLSRPGRFDPLEKARPDELLFPLMEHDPCAPPSILHWVDLRRKAAREIDDPEKRREELQQCTEAEFIAHEMMARQKGANADDADPIKIQLASIEESPIDAMMSQMRSMLSESDYFVHEALELAKEINVVDGGLVDGARLEQIKTSAAALHDAAMALSPHRAKLMAETELPLEGKS